VDSGFDIRVNSTGHLMALARQGRDGVWAAAFLLFTVPGVMDDVPNSPQQ
jgi:hypothetical protein